jgi:hypothetical protein
VLAGGWGSARADRNKTNRTPDLEKPDSKLGSWVGQAVWANLDEPDSKLGSWVGQAVWANLDEPDSKLGSWVG